MASFYEFSSVTGDMIFISIFRNVHTDLTWSYCRVFFLSFLLIAGSSKSIEISSLIYKFVASHQKVYLTISHIACIHRSSFKWQNQQKELQTYRIFEYMYCIKEDINWFMLTASRGPIWHQDGLMLMVLELWKSEPFYSSFMCFYTAWKILS